MKKKEKEVTPGFLKDVAFKTNIETQRGFKQVEMDEWEGSAPTSGEREQKTEHAQEHFHLARV